MRSPRSARSTQPRFSPLLQGLEPRLALSASVSLDGTLNIVGSPSRNTVLLQSTGQGHVALFGVPGVGDGTVFTGVIRIHADLKSGNDTFTANGSYLGATGLQIPFTILGGNGFDFFNAAVQGKVIANGGAGNDNIYGGEAGDNLKGGKGIDLIDGGIGNDRIEGQDGADTLCGGEDHDTLIGGNGPDILYGNQERDILRGGFGADLLVGGGGDDRVEGHNGADRFYATRSEAVDFAIGDVGFLANANPNIPTLSLFGHTAWNFLAAAEQNATRRLDGEIVAATDALLASLVACENSRERFISAADDDPSNVALVKTLFAGVLSGHAAEFANDPQGVTAQDIDELRDDLRVAAGTVPNFAVANANLDIYLTELYGNLTVQTNFLAAVHQMPANHYTTINFFNAFSAAINLVDDL